MGGARRNRNVLFTSAPSSRTGSWLFAVLFSFDGRPEFRPGSSQVSAVPSGRGEFYEGRCLFVGILRSAMLGRFSSCFVNFIFDWLRRLQRTLESVEVISLVFCSVAGKDRRVHLVRLWCENEGWGVSK